ncbi:hypothetical protein ACIBMZ_26535 [Micromonospora sp. NPDC049900]|uniref:hypothetical protein n=1 Tax=Micromonospora sp. NPDC049900 TaxID=3364275 RepID=UPI00378CAF47
MTAKGKKTTARLRPGDRVLITDDLSKASTRTGGRWHPSRVKTGATTATVSHLDTIAGRRTRYDVVTDAGTVPNLSGSQTFLLAPEDANPASITSVQRWKEIEQTASTPEFRACVAAGVENADDTMDEALRGVTDAVAGPFDRGDETWCRLAISGFEDLRDKGVFAHLNDVPPETVPGGWVQFHPDGPRVHPDYSRPIAHGGHIYDMVGRLELRVGDVILEYGADLRILDITAYQCTHPGHPRNHRWYANLIGLTTEDRRRTFSRPWGTALCLAYDRGIPRRRDVPDPVPTETPAPLDTVVERAYAVQVGREHTAWETVSHGAAVGPAPQLARDVAMRQAYPLDVDRWRVLVYADTDRDYPPVYTYGLTEANQDGLYCTHGDDPRHHTAQCPGRHP